MPERDPPTSPHHTPRPSGPRPRVSGTRPRVSGTHVSPGRRRTAGVVVAAAIGGAVAAGAGLLLLPYRLSDRFTSSGGPSSTDGNAALPDREDYASAQA